LFVLPAIYLVVERRVEARRLKGPRT